ncbi:MAG: hypothetical protein RM022_010375 [Nostoc sp. EfeVER01]|uniref:hypothetical protein n=1 Tax=unclassified Nostoc TaxID=2593658 RepID=UPI002AD33688|nr:MULTISPECIES: hypothetical protein [unclassified Nostoc]MDZ7948310.1 hypothetical protein [Nostoc sp. EfeVER01]MDZ7994998.1 hypothetical protein [Nostoc sp. EspVER01]
MNKLRSPRYCTAETLKSLVISGTGLRASISAGVNEKASNSPQLQINNFLINRIVKNT